MLYNEGGIKHIYRMLHNYAIQLAGLETFQASCLFSLNGGNTRASFP